MGFVGDAASGIPFVLSERLTRAGLYAASAVEAGGGFDAIESTLDRHLQDQFTRMDEAAEGRVDELMIQSDESESGFYGPTALQDRCGIAEDMLLLGMEELLSIVLEEAFFQLVEMRLDGAVVVMPRLAVREQTDDNGLGFRHEQTDIVTKVAVALQITHLSCKAGIDPTVHELSILIQTSRHGAAGIIESDFQGKATYGIGIRHQAKTSTRLLKTSWMDMAKAMIPKNLRTIYIETGPRCSVSQSVPRRKT